MVPFIEDQPKQPVYDINYFIKKFEAIPEEKWTEGELVDRDGRCCALGHCGATYDKVTGLVKTTEAAALKDIAVDIISVNDGTAWNAHIEMLPYYGSNPKERVLNYLYAIRDGKA